MANQPIRYRIAPPRTKSTTDVDEHITAFVVCSRCKHNTEIKPKQHWAGMDCGTCGHWVGCTKEGDCGFKSEVDGNAEWKDENVDVGEGQEKK
jgi:transcription elongation factor Elf1